MAVIAELEILDLPELPNKSVYKHWKHKWNNTCKWKKRVMHECYLHKIHGLNLEIAKLFYERHSSKEPDFDNLVASFKPVQDGLIEAGVIQDDKTKNIGQPSYKWFYKAFKSGGMIKIRIET